MTESARVEAQLAAPADAVWRFFRWDNLEAMLPGGFFTAVDYDKRAPVPGATRTITLAGGQKVVERLESLSPTGHGFRYRVLNLADFPLADYLGSVSVSPEEDGSCRIVFSCEFVPSRISAAEWREIYTAMQTAFIDFIRSQVETGDAHG
ncbi:SRPBCC family protein [Sphingosinicella humi]|uniref:SRPBCC family protein n=1 Tax=Allosphingosinicella humi TaxID=2068657 RepID=UPI00130500E3|nr:SRPBCC family protein [Sphingosinicella humi]